MKSQPLLVTVFAAALAFLSAGCDEHASIGVRIASGPTRAALGEMATFVVKLTYDGFFYSPTSRIRMEWGDTLTEISDPVAAGDSVLFKHAWLKSGTYQVTAVALAYPSRDHLHGQSGFHHRAIPSLTRRSSTPSGGRLSLSRSRITRAGRA